MLRLQRTNEIDETTLGQLFLDDKHFCYTLEDKVRPEKIYSKTAIPAGTYQIVITNSPKFKQMMPLLLNVPNYIGIRIHKGNNSDDTAGCILVGELIVKDKIVNSTLAYQRLFIYLTEQLKKGKVYIKIDDIPKIPEIIQVVEKPKEDIKQDTILQIPVTKTEILAEPKLTLLQIIIKFIKSWIQKL